MYDQLGFNQRDLGHGATHTILHPIVLIALAVAIILVWVLPRKRVIVPLLLIIFLVPRGQVVLLFGLHWYVRIIVLLVASARFLGHIGRLAGGITAIDKLFIVWLLYRIAATLSTNGAANLAEQLYFGIQAFCSYFLFRYLIRNEDDIALAARTFAVIVALLGSCMLYEHTRNVNIFGYLGGAPLVPEVRNGMTRAQGTFGHPILAGCFGATLVPLFWWLWKSGRAKGLAVAGLIGGSLMVLSSTSSTPLLAYVAGFLGLSLWPIRRSMRLVRWGIVVALAGLALVMKAPVWYIIAHVTVVAGSGSYDRAHLIDVFMRHIPDWWLHGTNQNGNWGFDMWDLSNQFIAEGEMGGLVTLVCFIAIISQIYSRLGKMRRTLVPRDQWLVWSLGAVMLAHIFAYFGVAYWDQTQIWWFAFLAMVPAATLALQESAAHKSTALSRQAINSEHGAALQA